MIEPAAWKEAAAALGDAGEAVVACHVHPDGDALGSMLGLGGYLRRLGKKVHMGWGSERLDVPPQYAFLPGIEGATPPSGIPPAAEVFVALDCGDESRLELLRPSFRGAGLRVNIDHHVSNHGFGDINLVDTSAASSAELVYELVKRMGGTPTRDEATCFYAGIVTDTGRFQYAATSPGTLRLAAELRELGVDHEKVAAEIYESESFEYLHVLGLVLSRARLDDGLVWSYLKQEDLDGLGMDETEHFIDSLRTVRESPVAAILKEMPDGRYKVSLRSKGTVDVSQIARAFGGGGHARAAGFYASRPVEDTVAQVRERIAAGSVQPAG